MTAVDPDYPLPSMEELTMPELEISSPSLKAGAHHFGKYCDNESKEFMLCMDEQGDPVKCLKYGREVTNCGWRFFNLVKANCLKPFADYAHCLDHCGQKLDLEKCRKTQKKFDDCVFDKLGWERPPIGYFSRIRLIDSDQVKPEDPVGTVPKWSPGPSLEALYGHENKPESEKKRDPFLF